ncbi:hypothetical protein [Aureibacter tunicatorum]|uniref:Uncharacterized protein n=1 Tax=Aureibacter tunicatorum TaxID=866807 RepID=A0AAE3XQR3_9BACT|nr:hypothetical protein [Aureibacter tunicatorum]MDR6240920.1 hypothetical protein [Aureibacter tunicatorum]BDD03700.1 hypothetical protein AUTU_11830 [Aureibacter tunicatorum]
MKKTVLSFVFFQFVAWSAFFNQDMFIDSSHKTEETDSFEKKYYFRDHKAETSGRILAPIDSFEDY